MDVRSALPIRFSINNSEPHQLAFVATGRRDEGIVRFNVMLLFTLNKGDMVVLSAGTLETTSPVDGHHD